MQSGNANFSVDKGSKMIDQNNQTILTKNLSFAKSRFWQSDQPYCKYLLLPACEVSNLEKNLASLAVQVLDASNENEDKRNNFYLQIESCRLTSSWKQFPRCCRQTEEIILNNEKIHYWMYFSEFSGFCIFYLRKQPIKMMTNSS